jgi:hypothetical protein
MKLDAASDIFNSMIAGVCQDCTVLNAQANLAYKDGKMADASTGVYVHHIILSNFGRPMIMPPVNPSMGGASCAGKGAKGAAPKAGSGGMAGMAHGSAGMKRQAPPKAPKPSGKGGGFGGMSVFVGGGGSAGSGNPFAVKGSAVKSGFYMGKNDQMQVMAEVVNYDKVEKDIYVTLDYEYVKGRPEGTLDVGMGAISVDSCGGPTAGFSPPKDKPIIYEGSEQTVMDNGYFINFTPHLHDGAVNIKIFVNGKEVCESKALYGKDTSKTTVEGWETITGYSPCQVAVPIKVGDKVKMTSEYDLTKHRLRPNSMDHSMEAEGMALANFIFAKAGTGSPA